MKSKVIIVLILLSFIFVFEYFLYKTDKSKLSPRFAPVVTEVFRETAEKLEQSKQFTRPNNSKVTKKITSDLKTKASKVNKVITEKSEKSNESNSHEITMKKIMRNITDFKARKKHVDEFCKQKHLMNKFPSKFWNLFTAKFLIVISAVLISYLTYLTNKIGQKSKKIYSNHNCL